MPTNGEVLECSRKGCSNTFIFDSRRHSRRYCSDACLIEVNKHVRKPPLDLRECQTCSKKFAPKVTNQRYCQVECRPTITATREEVSRRCVTCGRSFCPKSEANKYCSRSCYPNYYVPKKKDRRTVYSGFDWMVLFSEKEFHDWFNRNFMLFGIQKLLKNDPMFPDIVAEFNDGTRLNIELEYFAEDFKKHSHEPSHCDLIIAYAKRPIQSYIMGIPVVAIFDAKVSKRTGKVDLESRVLTAYFVDKVETDKKRLWATFDEGYCPKPIAQFI